MTRNRHIRDRYANTDDESALFTDIINGWKTDKTMNGYVERERNHRTLTYRGIIGLNKISFL